LEVIITIDEFIFITLEKIRKKLHLID